MQDFSSVFHLAHIYVVLSLKHVQGDPHAPLIPPPKSYLRSQLTEKQILHFLDVCLPHHPSPKVTHSLHYDNFRCTKLQQMMSNLPSVRKQPLNFDHDNQYI